MIVGVRGMVKAGACRREPALRHLQVLHAAPQYVTRGAALLGRNGACTGAENLRRNGGARNVTMNTPKFFAAPDYTPVVRMMAMQTRLAIETSQGLMKLAMMPWTGLPTGLASIYTPMARVTVSTSVVETAPDAEAAPAETVEAAAVDAIEETVVETVAEPEVTVAPKAQTVVAAEPPAEKTKAEAPKKAPKAAAAKVAAPKAAEPKAEAPKIDAPKVKEAKAAEPKAEAPKAKAAEPKAEAPKAKAAEPKAEAPKAKAEAPKAKPAEPKAEAPKTAAPVAEAKPAEVPAESTAAMVKPKTIAAPKGKADDLTTLNGVGPKLAEALNAEGIYSFAQIAAWSEANVAWIDENLPGVKGRASRNGWVAQAAKLAG